MQCCTRAGANDLLLQLALAFVEYHLKREEPLHHLGHAGAFISRLHAGHDKGMYALADHCHL